MKYGEEGEHFHIYSTSALLKGSTEDVLFSFTCWRSSYSYYSFLAGVRCDHWM